MRIPREDVIITIATKIRNAYDQDNDDRAFCLEQLLKMYLSTNQSTMIFNSEVMWDLIDLADEVHWMEYEAKILQTKIF